MLAHDSRLSSGIGSSLKDKNSIISYSLPELKGKSSKKPLADHFVDLLDSEAEVGRLEARVLV